jgi:outer membrane protein assembly factor BamB
LRIPWTTFGLTLALAAFAFARGPAVQPSPPASPTAALPLVASDDAWPQFGGPTRDFRAPADVRLAEAWPADGPARRWDRSLGEGYSGIVAGGSRLFTMFRRDGHEVVVALDAATGATVWEHAYAVEPLGDQDLSQGPGPHATPLVTGSVVCAAGVAGALHCLDLETGRLRWRRDLIRDLGGTPVFRGYSSSPLAWQDGVIVPVGGAGRGLVAFHRDDGRELWRAGDFATTNGSPILIETAGRPQVVAFTDRGLAAFDARTGAALWTQAHPQRFSDNISLPLWDGARVFCTSAMDGGARLIEIEAAGEGLRVRELWHQPRFGVYFTNVLWIDGHVYGTIGGLGPTFLAAVDLRTGEVAWQTREVPRASLLQAGDATVMLIETGELLLARLSPDGVDILARTPMLDEGPPAPLTLVGSTLFARDRSRIVALDLGAARRDGPGDPAGF